MKNSGKDTYYDRAKVYSEDTVWHNFILKKASNKLTLKKKNIVENM
jgi:hypothetical protein